MKLHGNARVSVKGRELLIERIEVAGWSLCAAAEAAGISERTASKWLARCRAEGPAGLVDRSSAPTVVADRTSAGSRRSSRSGVADDLGRDR
jgi:transposase